MPSRSRAKRRRERFVQMEKQALLHPVEREAGTRSKDIIAYFRRAAARWRSMCHELSEAQAAEDVRAYLECRSSPVDDRPIPEYVHDLLDAQRKTRAGLSVARERNRWAQSV